MIRRAGDTFLYRYLTKDTDDEDATATALHFCIKKKDAAVAAIVYDQTNTDEVTIVLGYVDIKVPDTATAALTEGIYYVEFNWTSASGKASSPERIERVREGNC